MRIGTRGSALALAQARMVAELLGEETEVVPITTSGDRGQMPGDKSRWVAELEQSLAGGDIDLAVHSAKDLPAELGPGLVLMGSPPRAGSEDVLCGAGALEQLPPGARVGTSSLRRLAQLQAAREDLEVVAIRGNVDTRLRRLRERHEGIQALVLARAGLQRLHREQEIGAVLAAERFVPAPGQGALALEGRAEDRRARAAAEAISDPDTLACLTAERALARALQASCNTPLGALARPRGERLLELRAWVGLPDGSAWVSDEQHGERSDPEALGEAVAERLLATGAGEILAQANLAAGAGGG